MNYTEDQKIRLRERCVQTVFQYSGSNDVAQLLEEANDLVNFILEGKCFDPLSDEEEKLISLLERSESGRITVFLERGRVRIFDKALYETDDLAGIGINYNDRHGDYTSSDSGDYYRRSV